MNDKIWKEIISNNIEKENKTLSEFACNSKDAIRLYDENLPTDNSIRPPFFRDTDRIIHSLAYSRYIDKTQVFFLFDNDHITHRVLHVQLVSKIARTIGRFLKLNEDLIEAIALGHDIGHTPFGHDGEKYLNSILKQLGLECFCHNAQSVRFLKDIENRGKGLNLTLQVYDGILCHNGEIVNHQYESHAGKNFDFFLEEYKNCFTDPEYSLKIRPMTLEGCVVRVSDVIAYIGRDIEDAITVKLLTREELPREATEILGNNNRDIIDKLIKDLIINSYGKNVIQFSDEVYNSVKILKDFNYEKIYRNPLKTSQDQKIEQMFRMLFEKFYLDLKNGNKSSVIYKDFLIDMEEEYIKNNILEKIVADFIAGMTDDYFRYQFQDMFFVRSFGYCYKV